MPLHTKYRFTALILIVLVAILLIGVNKPNFQATGDFSEVQASSADSLADLVGVNVHDLYTDSQYEQIYKPRLREAEIRYIRGDMEYMEMTILNKISELSNPTDGKPPVKYLGISPYRDKYPGSALNDCFLTLVKTMVKGGKILCGSSLGQTLAKPIKFAGIEGPNEVDHCISNDPICQPKLPANATWWQDAEANNPNWIADTERTVKSIHDKLKSDPATSNIPILAPTFVHLSSFRSDPHPPYGDLYGRLLKLRPYFDYGNAHIYCETTPFNALCSSRWYQPPKDYAGKPLIVTETGYHTNPAKSWNVSESLQEKYGIRELLDLYDLGVKQAYIYQLIDEVSVPGIGIVRLDGSPKPLFNSIKNLNTLLDDRGSSFNPGKLKYRISTTSSSVKSTLLQKRDGSFYLVIRNDAGISSTEVTLQLGLTAKGIEVYDLASLAPTSQYTDSASVSLSIPDRVTVIKITPSDSSNSQSGSGQSSSEQSRLKLNSQTSQESGSNVETWADFLLPNLLVENVASKELASTIVFGGISFIFLLVVAVAWLWRRFTRPDRDEKFDKFH